MASEELKNLSIDMANGTIPAEAIQETQTSLDLADPIDETSDRDALLAESNAAIGQIEGDLARTREKQSSEEQAAARLIQSLGEREAFTSELEDKFGLNELESQLSGISSQISAENKLAPARILQAQKDAEGTGLTTSSLSTRISNRERDNAIRSLVLGAEADIIQGRVDAANARINRAVDAKFKPMENELELRKFNLERVDRLMERTETKLSTEQQKKYDQQIKKIEKEEQEIADRKSAVQGLSTTIAQNGAPQEAIQAVLNSETTEDAIAAAATYLKDPFMDIEMQLRQAQLNATNESIAASREARTLARDKFNRENEVNMLEDGSIVTPDGQVLSQQDYEQGLLVIEALNNVKNSDKRNMSQLGAWWANAPVRSAAGDFKDDVDRLKNLLTLDNLGLMSGVLSETDIQILQSAGTNLSLGQTNAKFDAELQRIQNTLTQKMGSTLVGGGGAQAAGPVTFDVSADGNIVLPAGIGGVGSTPAVVGLGDDQFWSQEN